MSFFPLKNKESVWAPKQCHGEDMLQCTAWICHGCHYHNMLILTSLELERDETSEFEERREETSDAVAYKICNHKYSKISRCAQRQAFSNQTTIKKLGTNSAVTFANGILLMYIQAAEQRIWSLIKHFSPKRKNCKKENLTVLKKCCENCAE